MLIGDGVGTWLVRLGQEIWRARGLASMAIIPLGIFVAARWLDRRRRLSSERERAHQEILRSGLYILPRTPREADELHLIALQSETLLRRRFVQGRLRTLLPRDVVAVSYLELPMRRALLSGWSAPRKSALRQGHIELHARRGEGLTTLLADLAVEVSSSRRQVVFGSYDDLFQQEQSNPQDLAHALGVLSRRTRTSRTVLVLDDAPSRADSVASDSDSPAHYLAGLIQALDPNRVRLVIGTSTRTEQPDEETHTPWFGVERQIDATPPPSERRAIGEHWLRLAGAPDERQANVGPSDWNPNESLVGVIAAAWRGLRGTSFHYMEELAREYSDLAELHPDLMLLAAVGRVAEAPVPEAVLAGVAGSKGHAETLATFKGLVTQSRVRTPGTGLGYELVSLVLAGRVVDDCVEGRTRLEEMLVRWIERSPADVATNHYWRLLLHRLASDEIVVVKQALVARAAVSAFKASRISRLEPADFEDRLSKLAYGATLRRMGRKESAARLYNSLLTTNPDFDGEIWFFASMIIGIIDCTPDQAQSAAVRRLACDLAAAVNYLPTKMAMGLASSLGAIARGTQRDLAGLLERSSLLGAAEALLAGHRNKASYESRLAASFASVVGGLYGDYYNRSGKSRPDFDLALRAADAAFDHDDQAVQDDRQPLPLQSLVAHRIRARILDLRGLPGDDALADEEYRASFHVPDPSQFEIYGTRYAEQYVQGAIDYAFRLWKRGRLQEASEWYSRAVQVLETDIPIRSRLRAGASVKAARFFERAEPYIDLDLAQSLLLGAMRESSRLAQDKHHMERLVKVARQRADAQMKRIESALIGGDNEALRQCVAEYVDTQFRIEEIGRLEWSGREARRRLGQLLLLRGASPAQRTFIAEHFAYRIVHLLVGDWVANPDPRALAPLVNLIELHGHLIAEEDKQRLLDRCSTLPDGTSTQVRADLENALARRHSRRHRTTVLEQYLDALP